MDEGPPIHNDDEPSYLLVEAVSSRLGFAPNLSQERFRTPGWSYEGSCGQVSCPSCSGERLEVWRKPWNVDQPNWCDWAIICPSCKTAVDLQPFTTHFKKKLGEWSDALQPSDGPVTITAGTSVPSLVEVEFGSRPSATHPRFLEAGWSFQGVSDVVCADCENEDPFLIYRKPNSDAPGGWRWWAVVCLKCNTVISLGDFDQAGKALLRDWELRDGEVVAESDRPSSDFDHPESGDWTIQSKEAIRERPTNPTDDDEWDPGWDLQPPWFPDAFDAGALDGTLLDLVDAVLDQLKERERGVLQRRLGLDPYGRHTLQDVGDDYGVSRERIRQIEVKAVTRWKGRVNRFGDRSGSSEHSLRNHLKSRLQRLGPADRGLYLRSTFPQADAKLLARVVEGVTGIDADLVSTWIRGRGEQANVSDVDSGKTEVPSSDPALDTVPGNSTRGPVQASSLPGTGSVETALRAWRLQRARNDEVPAFVVLHDRTLYAIADLLPTTNEELLAISGIGPAKVETYGVELLDVIATTIGDRGRVDGSTTRLSTDDPDFAGASGLAVGGRDEPGSMDSASTRAEPQPTGHDFEQRALAYLRLLTGKPDSRFRNGQLDAISTLVRDRGRVLVVERTGWGKSAVYFIATRMLRDQGFGPSLLISPLLALMQNQVDAASAMGVRAATVNSSNVSAWDQLRERLNAGEIDLLLVSEQRLSNDRFRREWLPKLGQRVGMLVVDEVHCISDWGHDFRPHYRRIGRFIQQLPANVPVIGCTATANNRVIADVEKQLGDDIKTIRGPLRREGLRLEVHSDKSGPDARLAWLVANLPDLSGTGIIYCLTRRDVVNVAEFLREHGIDCATYMGGGDQAAIAGKAEVLERFLANDLKCIVATPALGMGYDKPDVAFVIHYQMPSSPIAYYQQVGRAGRTLPSSYGILLAGAEDREIQDWFIDQAFPEPGEVAAVLAVLDKADGALRPGQIAALSNVGTKRLDNILLQLEVEGAVAKENGGWQRTLLPWTYPRRRIENVNRWRRAEQDAMTEYLHLDGCRMAFLQQQLDDPPSGSCGICDVCTGTRFGREPGEAAVNEAADRLLHANVEIEPMRRWPDGLAAPSGPIPAAEQAETGWCLASWADSGWGELIRIGKQRYGRFDDQLVDALAELVTSRINARVEWITYVPSLRHPDLVVDFARRVGRRLALPVVDAVVKVRETEPQKAMQNAHRQVLNLVGAFEVAAPVPASACLLIDDIIDSTWTMTIVAGLLRRGGAETVTPLALAYAGQSA